MLNWLFGKKPTEPAHGNAQRGEDQVWMNQAARKTGVAQVVRILVEAERSVVVVVLSMQSLDSTLTDLAQLQPVRCAEVFAKDALRASLARAGSVAVALDRALPADLAPIEGGGVDIVVIGRHDTREADEAIERFADSLGRNAHLTFHLALDDPLLQAFGPRIGPLVAQLGMNESEPIESAMVTRAIEQAQRKQSAA